MLHFLETDGNNPDFRRLVVALDAYLAIQDGDEHDFYDQFNKIDHLQYVLVASDATTQSPVACGAIKPYADGVMEVKRMFVKPEQRGRGIASALLMQLERWAAALHHHTCILETGVRQLEAIALYQKCGYRIIENYGQYTGVENSMCFEKKL
jgi:putative acetyltransferase